MIKINFGTPEPCKQDRVYVVTEGEYSDYQILGIFTSEEKAWKFASISYDRTVEEYILDPVEVDGLIHKNIHITYDFSKNQIVNVWLSDEEIPVPFIPVEYMPCLFKFQISNTTRNFIEYARERDHGDSSLLLKISQDKFAEYMEKEEKSKQELYDQSVADCRKYEEEQNRIHEEQYKKNKEERRRSQIAIYSTSSSGIVDAQLKQLISEGKPLPSAEEVASMIEKVKKSNSKGGEYMCQKQRN